MQLNLVGASDFTLEQCQGLGFTTSDLLCSSCKELGPLGLEPLIDNCKKCCQHDGGSDEGAAKVNYLFSLHNVTQMK